MSLAREFMSALAMLEELRTEGEPAIDLPPLPTLDSSLPSLPPVPPAAALLGVASEGMPVMLDLRNPAPGPLLVLGDAGSGKTDFLRFAAAAVIRTHGPDEVQFCVLTPAPDEWPGFTEEDHCLGVVDANSGAAAYALGRLAGSIHENPGGSAVLLMVDDLTSLDAPALEALCWALVEGPAAGLWPLVTMNSEAALGWSEWVEPFQTRIFGHMENPQAAHLLAPAPGGGLHNLLAGAQFTLRSQGHWLRFWVPLVPVRGPTGRTR